MDALQGRSIAYRGSCLRGACILGHHCELWEGAWRIKIVMFVTLNLFSWPTVMRYANWQKGRTVLQDYATLASVINEDIKALHSSRRLCGW